MSTKQFEIGKFYKKSTKDREWFIKIIGYKYDVFQGVCVKQSRYENYITDADIFLEFNECVEITQDEFERFKETVINSINQK